MLSRSTILYKDEDAFALNTHNTVDKHTHSTINETLNNPIEPSISTVYSTYTICYYVRDVVVYRMHVNLHMDGMLLYIDSGLHIVYI